MRDALGWRKKFGVLAPSTNTIVAPDYYRMTVPGVTAHFSRIFTPTADLSSTDAVEQFLKGIRAEMRTAFERVLTCEPDYLIMGMSAETFWGGAEGNRRLVERMQDWTGGLGVATGAEACERSLKVYGAKRVGVVTPYQPNGDENVVRFFNDVGVDVLAIKGLRCPSPVSIAYVEEETLRDALQEVNVDGVEALVQVGTNVSMVQLADEAERWLRKPVIAINAATWWMALRDNGIEDKIYGCGRLLRDF